MMTYEYIDKYLDTLIKIHFEMSTGPDNTLIIRFKRNINGSIKVLDKIVKNDITLYEIYQMCDRVAQLDTVFWTG
jgi:hypothetical protein